MKEPLESRLAQLKSELQLGQTRLDELESEAADLRQTLLRIAGTIQVLEKMRDEQTGADTGSTP